MSKITQSAISQKLVNPTPPPKKNQKILIWVTKFYIFLPIYGSKFKIQMAKNLH